MKGQKKRVTSKANNRCYFQKAFDFSVKEMARILVSLPDDVGAVVCAANANLNDCQVYLKKNTRTYQQSWEKTSLKGILWKAEVSVACRG